MTPNIFRALRGPSFLIVLGLLFAADQSGTLSLGQSWPAILILFGGFMLLERFSRRSTPPQQPNANPFPNSQYPGGNPQ